MKIGLVGWGLETQSAYRYFGGHHDYLIVSEEPRDDLPKGSNVTIQTNEKKRKPGLTANAEDLNYLVGIDTSRRRGISWPRAPSFIIGKDHFS